MSNRQHDDMVVLECDEGVATVTLNKPDVHNAFDDHVIARLSHIWDELSARDDVIAVVLRGAGKSFSAGADLNWMKRAADYTEQQNQIDAHELASMLHKLYSLPKTTIACVQGAAFGGGLGLVSCCDIVLADETAKFALSEVKLGLIPATIAPYVLRAIGERQARRYFQTGERFDGQTAHKIGLVHELCKDQKDVESKLSALLDGLNANGPRAMAASKQLCLDYAEGAITEKVLEETARRIAKTRAGDEAKEGLSAFLEKRKAAWVR